MIPVLFERDEVDFQSNGIGQLPNVLDSYAYEIGNAEYELNLTYPTVNDVDGYPNSIWKELKVTERQILYKPSHSRKPHAFRIYNYEIDSVAQTITVYGRSRAYDLGNNVVKTVNINNQTPQVAMNTMKTNLVEPTDFDFYSDMSTTSSTKWERQSGLSTIMGEEGSLIQYWGGEVLRENTRISLYNRVGKDNVTTLRLGKNIEQLNYDLRTDNMVTAIIPFYRYTPEGENQEEIVVTGNTVKSSKFNNYRLPYYQFVEYNEQDDNVTNLTTLNNAASKWFSEHPNVDEPTLTINVDMVDVAESTEYAELLKSLEQVNVFDTVSVYISEYDIDVVVKVVSLKYDGFNERNLEVELGSASSGLFETFVNPQFDSISKQLDDVRKIGVDAQISADGKNTNYQGSVDPNEAGLVGDDGDIYFRTIGTEKQMWQYQVNQWNLILDTSRIDDVEKEVSAIIAQADTDRTEAEQNFEQAVRDATTYTDTKTQEFDNKLVAVNQEVANVTQAVNTAVSKADQAIQDVGFMQTDVNTAKTNAVEALTKAQKATEDVNVLTTDFDELTQTVSLKAEKTAVDSVKNTVDQHSLDISANAQAINARLTSAQVDTLLEGKKYVNETTLNATANGLSASITQVSNDLSNLEIGGRNFLPDSHFFNSSGGWYAANSPLERTGDIISITSTGVNASATRFENSVSLEKGIYTLSLRFRSTSGIALKGFTNVSFIQSTSEYLPDENWVIGKITFEVIDSFSRTLLRIYLRDGSVGKKTEIDWIKLEKGNKATDWTPAPEDMATLEQFTTIEATIQGLQTTVGNKAEQSQVTQLAGQISSKVESATYNSKMTQLDSAINLRVTKGDVTAQINVEAGVTLISNKKLLLDANTYIMGTTFANDVKAKSLEAVYADIATLKTKVLTADVITSTMLKSDTALITKLFATDANVNVLTAKTAFINSVKAVDIAADRITSGTFNGAKMNVININASAIVANTLSSITANTGALNVSGWLTMASENKGILGEYDFGDNYGEAFNYRWFTGDYRLSHRHLLFTGKIYNVNTTNTKGSYLYDAETFLGNDYLKMRQYSSTKTLLNRVDVNSNQIVLSEGNWNTASNLILRSDGTSYFGGNMLLAGEIEMTGGRSLNTTYINSASAGANINFNAHRTELADFRIGKDGSAINNGRVVLSKAIYNRTYSNTANVVVTADGVIGRSVSARKYKLNIKKNDLLDIALKTLDINPSSWFDKGDVESLAKAMSEGAVDLLDSTHQLKRHHGFIADEFHEKGATEVVTYDSNGEVEGLAYDRITMYHHELIRDLYKKIEEQNKYLESVKQ